MAFLEESDSPSSRKLGFRAEYSFDELAPSRCLENPGAKLLSHPDLYSAAATAKRLREEHIGEDLPDPPDWGMDNLVKSLRARLEQAVSSKRREGDWAIHETIKCHCKDCKELERFLKDPSQQKLTWPLAKDRRRHIHGTIDRYGLPVSHVTHRTGSPQKLMLTKLPSLFEKDHARNAAAAQELKYVSTTALSDTLSSKS